MFKKGNTGLVVIRGSDQASLAGCAIDDRALGVSKQDQARAKRIGEFDRRLQGFRELIQEPLKCKFFLPREKHPLLSRRPLMTGGVVGCAAGSSCNLSAGRQFAARKPESAMLHVLLALTQ